MTSLTRALALAAALAVLAPLCGAMVALLCQDDCCCPPVQVDPCANGVCMTSVPVLPSSAVGNTIEKPMTAGAPVEPLTAEAPVQHANPPRPPDTLAAHSPPDLFLKNCLFLI